MRWHRWLLLLAAVALTTTVVAAPTDTARAGTAPVPFGSTEQFVTQQYMDFLGRVPDAAGVGFWVDRIRQGKTTPEGMIEQFLGSAEFGAKVAPVARLYFAYFLRIPDFPGLTYWVSQVRAGRSLEAVSDAFASSAEFRSRYGNLGNQDFVRQVYQNVLGRLPDGPGLAYWTGELNAGRMSRGAVMIGFSESSEYRVAMTAEINVVMTYVGMLRRSPDRGGFDYWVGQLDGGRSIRDLCGGLLTSAEYARRFAPYRFRDDFAGSLAGGWTWLREDSERWSLTDAPGWLRLQLRPSLGSLPPNVLLRDLPSGDFEFSTRVRFTPTGNFQIAGLVAYEGVGDLIQLGRAYCSAAAVCVGDGIYFDHLRDGDSVGSNFATSYGDQGDVYLRLRVEANRFTALYSRDGSTWTQVGTHYRTFGRDVRIGLIAHQSQVSGPIADFDYWEVAQLR